METGFSCGDSAFSFKGFAFSNGETGFSCEDSAFSCEDSAFSSGDSAFSNGETGFSCEDSAFSCGDSAFSCGETGFSCEDSAFSKREKPIYPQGFSLCCAANIILNGRFGWYPAETTLGLIACRICNQFIRTFIADPSNINPHKSFLKFSILKTAWPAFIAAIKPDLLLFNFLHYPKLKPGLPVQKAIKAVAVFSLLFSSFAAPVGPIELHPQLLPFVPKEFFVAEVLDNRNDKTALAWVYLLPASKQKPALQALDLKGGGTTALQNFMLKSLPRNKALRPITIRIKECKVTETIAAPGRVEGWVALSLVFELQNETGNIYLTDYRLDTKYNRSENQLNIWEPALQDSFTSALKYFNTWMDQQSDHNPKLAKLVKVNFINYHEKPEGDTIYYSSDRLLTWTDFQDKPQGGKYAAMVFPSFGFEEKTAIKNGEIILNLELKVYVPKSACWVKPGNQNDYSLNHEQRHFDLVAIVGRHFEQKIKAAKLPVSNPDGVINVAYYESFREMNRLQKQYDDETNHGINIMQQQSWNKRIDQDLISLGIKHNS